MRQQRRALSLFLIIALLLNLFLPMPLVSAANGADGVVDCTSVTDDAYAKEPEPCTEEEQQELPSVGLLDEIELVAASQEIVENIITDVKIYANPDNEGNPLDNPPIEIQDIRPEVGDPVSVHYV